MTWKTTSKQFKINDIAKYLSLKHEVDVICNIPDYHKGKYYKGYKEAREKVGSCILCDRP